MFYYVAMHNAGKSYLLAGPYAEESRAEAAKDAARAKACEIDGYNHLHTYSLARSEVEQKTAFGII